jgi:hypothetical protein
MMLHMPAQSCLIPPMQQRKCSLAVLSLEAINMFVGASCLLHAHLMFPVACCCVVLGGSCQGCQASGKEGKSCSSQEEVAVECDPHGMWSNGCTTLYSVVVQPASKFAASMLALVFITSKAQLCDAQWAYPGCGCSPMLFRTNIGVDDSSAC